MDMNFTSKVIMAFLGHPFAFDGATDKAKTIAMYEDESVFFSIAVLITEKGNSVRIINRIKGSGVKSNPQTYYLDDDTSWCDLKEVITTSLSGIEGVSPAKIHTKLLASMLDSLNDKQLAVIDRVGGGFATVIINSVINKPRIFNMFNILKKKILNFLSRQGIGCLMGGNEDLVLETWQEFIDKDLSSEGRDFTMEDVKWDNKLSQFIIPRLGTLSLRAQHEFALEIIRHRKIRL